MSAEYEGYPSPRKTSSAHVMHGAAAACIIINVVLSPWLFGSWEMWWFWPMVLLIFAACLFSGIGALLNSAFSHQPSSGTLEGRFSVSHRIIAVAAACVPFLLYALVRSRFGSDTGRPLVAMDAERSLLLFFSPAAMAIVMFLSFSRTKLRILAIAFLANALAIAVYATINQFHHNGDYVLWVLSEWTYGGRAKAVFFCPNHLSAYLNIAICMSMALLFTPRISLRCRIAAVAMTCVLLVPNFLTLSRGGLASLAAGMAIGLSTVAMRGYRPIARIIMPVAVLLAMATATALVFKTDNPLRTRIEQHSLYKSATGAAGTGSFLDTMTDTFWYRFDRGMYIQSALRAWQSNPVWGIGPGQHSSRWPEFAATPDGVRPIDGDISTMKRPRNSNSYYHLYEVHSDWTQLLEEYGIVGFVLFLAAAFAVVFTLVKSQSSMNACAAMASHDPEQHDHKQTHASGETRVRRKRSSRHRHRHGGDNGSLEKEDISQIERILPLAALLAAIVMAVHSLGDFSFQMPSITWTFAAIVTAAILVSSRTGEA